MYYIHTTMTLPKHRRDDACEGRYPFPVFLNLNGQTCLVVGGGPVALRKTADLVEAGASVTVVAESPITDFRKLSSDRAINLRERRFRPDDAAGMFLVIAATDDNEVNGEVFRVARERGALVNVVDSPALCDFFSGAVVKRGPLRIAVSTSGCVPGLAAFIRRELEEQYDETWSAYLEAAREIRRDVLSREGLAEKRKNEALAWLGTREAFSLFTDSGRERVWERIRQIISC